MTEYARKILRHLNGENVPDLCWGPAMGKCIEWLVEQGYAQRSTKHFGNVFETTDKGRAAIAEQKAAA